MNVHQQAPGSKFVCVCARVRVCEHGSCAGGLVSYPGRMASLACISIRCSVVGFIVHGIGSSYRMVDYSVCVCVCVQCGMWRAVLPALVPRASSDDGLGVDSRLLRVRCHSGSKGPGCVKLRWYNPFMIRCICLVGYYIVTCVCVCVCVCVCALLVGPPNGYTVYQKEQFKATKWHRRTRSTMRGGR